jgi:hypothetical protein
MAVVIDPAIVSMFGGQARAATLGALASARQPLTAYRVAKMTGCQVIKVMGELRGLERAGVVGRVSRSGAATGWYVSDRSLRDFLRRRIRIVWWGDWDREVGRRARRSAVLRRTRVDLSRFKPSPRGLPNRGEFIRSRGKDRELARIGLPVSRRSARRR